MRSRRLVQLLLLLVFATPGTRTALAAEPDPQDGAKSGGDARTLAAANGFLNRGHYDLAIQEYRRFLDSHSDSADADVARYGLGVALFRSGKPADAADALIALEEKRNFAYAAEVNMMLGQSRVSAGEFETAAGSFRRLLDDHSGHALADDAAAQLIEVLYRLDKDSDCSEACDKFIAKWSDSPQIDRAAYFGGLADMRREKSEEAAKRFKLILEKRKDGPFAAHSQLLLARCLQNRNPKEAATAYKAVLARNDSLYRDEASLGLASLLRLEGDYSEAADLLKPLVDKTGKAEVASGAVLQLAHVEFGRGDYAKALKLFQQSAGKDKTQHTIEPRYWAAKCMLRLEKPADAARELEEVVENADDSALLPEILHDEAVALHRKGDSKAAMLALEQLIDRFSDHALVPSAWHLLAVICHEGGDYARSLEWTAKFLSKHVKHELAARVFLLSAENEFLLAHYDRAESAFREFLKKYPDDANARTARYRLGMSLYHLEKYDEALTLLAEIQTGDIAAFSALYLALGDIAFRKEEWETALKWLSLHLEKNAKPVAADEALLKSGLSAARLAKHDDAVRFFDRLLAEFPESPHALQARFERGQSFLVQAAYEKAGADFEAVLKADEKSRFAPAARKHLAAVAMQRGDYGSAAEQYETLASTSRGDDEAEPLYQQAMAQLSAKDNAGAKKTLRKLLRKFEDSPRANAARARLAILLSREGKCGDFIEMQNDVVMASLDAGLQRSLNYERAWCLKSLGKPDEAATAYRALLEQSSDDVVAAHALVEIAEIDADAGRLDEAIKRLTAFEKLESAGSLELPVELREQALYRQGVAFFKTKNYAKSAEYFDRFCKAFERSALAVSASYFQGESLFQSGDCSAAASCFDRVIAANAKGAELETSLLRAGDCRAKLQQWAKSESAFESLLDQFSASEQWYQAEFGLGWARENQGRFADAAKSYRKVVDRHTGPTAARAQFQIGQCLFAEKKLDDAVGELLKVDILYAYPDWSAAALYEAGRCFEQMNKMAEAKKQFNTVVEKYKSTKWGELAAARLDALASNKAPGRGT